ncbi:NEP1-interacting protein [Actinidia chinensis var. chinensis]|uniref:NEP1-interacting protein n=1 Tax=Actinidia chinensis var. chinensis TaxID=1590841 RepID=A0A2R6QDH9_ACTCC|nr:NEP1-interacting protein [Actinidia chinensis var. chinensis]
MTNLGWFSVIPNMALRCKQAFSRWVFEENMDGFGSGGGLFKLLKKTVFALLTCSLALGGASVGTISGAIKGQTTETGFLRGAAIGAVAGAITAVQLMELTVHGESFSKAGLFFSVINGKAFREWVSPAVLKAYQWQISSAEASFRDSSDIFEMNGIRGLSQRSIEQLPKFKVHPRPCQQINCIICLEDLKMGDFRRMLPSCGHSFHSECIDEWLTRNGSCPTCRTDVLNQNTN